MINPHKLLRILQIALFCCAGTALAQTDLPTVIPPTPNAAALGKFGDTPVSPYTGLPSIDIPLFTISSGDLSVPVSLSYHAGGIKMSEDAGWTGLGWAINAGGMVSRSIYGKDDLENYVTNSVPEMTEKALETVVIMGTEDFENKYTTSSGTEYFFGDIIESWYGYDFEADAFNYSFPGKNGKFIFDRKGQIILQKQEDIIVEHSGDASFTITDENGVTYDFSNKEFGEVNTGGFTPTSWYLSKITSLKGHTITFQYGGHVTIAGTPQFSQTLSSGCPGEGLSDMISNVTHQALYLERIDFDNGHLDFIYDNERLDYFSGQGKKIADISLYYNDSSTPAKQFTFGYGYFNIAKNDYKFRRLKLVSLQESNPGLTVPPHTFTYIESVPGFNIETTSKNTFSIDHWGYYNGRDNTSLIPPYAGPVTLTSGVTNIVTLSGASRSPDAEKAKLFSLREIKYPTGGKTVLTMEGNTQNPFLPGTGPSESQPEYETKYETFIHDKNETGTKTFPIELTNKIGDVTVTISFISSTNDGCAAVKSQTNRIASANALGLYREVTSTDLNCQPQGPACTGTFVLSNVSGQTHTITTFIDPDLTGLERISVNVSYVRPKVSESDTQRYLNTGGLRVRQIEHYDANNVLASAKRYEYHYEEDYNNDGIPEDQSYGKQMSPVLYARYQIVPGDSDPRCASFTRSSSSVTSLNTSAQGSIVGYGTVREYSIAGDSTNGMTIYIYENHRDETSYFNIPNPDESPGSPVWTSFVGLNVRKPGIRNLSNPRNGLLLEQNNYRLENSQYQLVHQTKNSYTSVNPKTYYNISVEEYPSNTFVVLTYFYPAMQTQFIRLDQTTETTVGPNDNTPQLVTTKQFYHESPSHHQPTRIVQSTSDQAPIQTTMLYAGDGINNLSTHAEAARRLMIAKNMIATPLLTRQTRNAKVTTTRSDFRIFNEQVPLMRGIFSSTTGDANLEERVHYSRYDAQGNVVSLSKTNDLKIAHQWGYNNSYPVAEVRNAENKEETSVLVESSRAKDFTVQGVTGTGTVVPFAVDYSGPVVLKFGMQMAPAEPVTLTYSCAAAGIQSQQVVLSSNSACDYHTVTLPGILPGVYKLQITLSSASYISLVKACGSITYPAYSSSSQESGVTEFFYEGFEDNTAAAVINDASVARTGNRYFNGDYQLNFAVPANGKKYILEYWYLESPSTWTLKSLEYTGPGLLLTDGQAIDDVRVSPSTAQMTTYTYKHGVGITSVTDANNVTVFYEYDELGRLKLVRNHKREIVKAYHYHYRDGQQQ